MRASLRVWLVFFMAAAMAAGLLQPLMGQADLPLRRLHVFLFNLLAGGTLVVYYLRGRFDWAATLYMLFALAYVATAALDCLVGVVLISLPLALLLVHVYAKRFGWLPLAFFRRRPAGEKFAQAAGLCLVLAVLAAALVAADRAWWQQIDRPKLALDVFFLGFSFPVSLMTFAVMFGIVRPADVHWKRRLEEVAFWSITLGVGVFFVFIVLEIPAGEIACAVVLSAAVLLVFFYFALRAEPVQKKHFLLSGMCFLLLTAATGLLYPLAHYLPNWRPHQPKLLELHGTLSLYGWNLAGMISVLRAADFPLRLNTKAFIGLHWLTVLVLVPLAKNWPPLGLVAGPAFLAILLLAVFSGNGSRSGRAGKIFSSGVIPPPPPRALIPGQRVVVTGATGLIGRKLTELLVEAGWRPVLLVRRPEAARRLFADHAEYIGWDFHRPAATGWPSALEGAAAVVHLAGTPLFAHRWTETFQREMEESRTQSTRQLVEAVGRCTARPQAFICASAVGIYGLRPEVEATEDTPAADDLLARICLAWEAEARRVEEYGLRSVQIRTGIVLDPKEGALGKLLPLFRLGLGGVIGRPEPWLNWIHLEDIVRIYLLALVDERVRGPYNAVAPRPVRNREFVATLAAVLRRPARLRVPEPLLRLAIGPAARFASGGARVSSQKIQLAGYRFIFEELDLALRQLLQRPEGS